MNWTDEQSSTLYKMIFDGYTNMAIQTALNCNDLKVFSKRQKRRKLIKDVIKIVQEHRGKQVMAKKFLKVNIYLQSMTHLWQQFSEC